MSQSDEGRQEEGSVSRSLPSSNRRRLPSHAPPRKQPRSEQAVEDSSYEEESEKLVVEDVPQVSSAATNPLTTSMSQQEIAWWAMSFEELYQCARNKRYQVAGLPRRKNGRARIIKWLCETEGITPYIAASLLASVEPSPVISSANLRPTGAISHPEAILRTRDPGLQKQIDEAEKAYKTWPAADLLTLSMQRSYQLLKDSNGKLPSKSISAMANWLAAWDVLKSDREKKWWLGDGIDLVNKAKAIGYEGPSRKYDVIVWLRTTPEEVDAEIKEIAEPTPNEKPVDPLKRRLSGEGGEGGELSKLKSKRPAKGSRRPNGWYKVAISD